MSKKSSKLRSAAVFDNLNRLALQAHPLSHPGHPADDGDGEPLDLSTLVDQPIRQAPDASRTLRMKKFRAQLLHRWLVDNFAPCRAADIGGGKGLLSYLLARSGWDAAVIDPYGQPLPEKYKDITSGARVKIDPGETVPHLDAEFEVELARGFDMLVGMHAHGCNVKIIDAAAKFGCGFVIFPCCIINEPFYPPLGVHWLESLADYAVQKGQSIFPFRLNFKGQNIGLCHIGGCKTIG